MGFVPRCRSPCHAVWDFAIFHQYDTAPNPGAEPGVARPAVAPTTNVSRAILGGHIITAVVRSVQEHAPGRPQRAATEPLRCLVPGSQVHVRRTPVGTQHPKTKIGWPIERARSVFETPARFERATLSMA